jgi:alpha-tubulin suppressor-like RCC1 family protein
VVQIACGESHSLVITDKGYLYSWGRGYEGQLGLSPTIELAMVPSFVKYFHEKHVVSIAAGAFYSLAITNEGAMYGWGEAKLGQLGVDKHRDLRTPTQIRFPPTEEGSNVFISSCSAGYGHTAALSNQGQLYTWGFNNYGQTGHGDLQTHWYPEPINTSDDGRQLGAVIKVVCGKYSTYAIDAKGTPYSWGKGFIGHGANSKQLLPKKIENSTDNRVFTNVFANNDSVLFYAPIRVFDVKPQCGPSKGGTLLRIIGTGFTESDKLAVRFTYGNLSREVAASFNSEDNTISCRTPTFDEFQD